MNSHLAEIGDELGISCASLTARGLRECQEAVCLEIAEQGADGRDHLLTAAAVGAWRTLKAAALADGVSLVVVSAFRSIERQAEIIRRKLAAGSSIEEVLTVCAPPGFSEHHTGRAVDVTTPGCPPLEVEFDQTPAYSWLTEHANRFGFHLSYPMGNSQGYLYEPWHWCFREAEPCGQLDLVFVFGTLKEGFPNFTTNRGVRVPGVFETKEPYPLYLVGERHSPWLIDEPGHGMRVEGQVFRVDRETLNAMDRLERVSEPDGYRRIVLELESRDSPGTVIAFAYVKAPCHLELSEIRLGPIKEYSDAYAALYRPRA